MGFFKQRKTEAAIFKFLSFTADFPSPYYVAGTVLEP